MLNFKIGSNYSRADVKELAGIDRKAKGGNWDTGIVEHDCRSRSVLHKRRRGSCLADFEMPEVVTWPNLESL